MHLYGNGIYVSLKKRPLERRETFAPPKQEEKADKDKEKEEQEGEKEHSFYEITYYYKIRTTAPALNV